MRCEKSILHNCFCIAKQTRILYRVLSLLLFIVCYFAPVTVFAVAEIRDTEIESVLNDIVNPLTKNAKIHLIADNDFNAYVLGGNDIYINTGLINKIDSPAELQAVLAHEIGHYELGHMVQMKIKLVAETKRALILQALGIGLIAINPQAALGMMAGGSGIPTQSMLAFTRDEERAADDFAVKLLKKLNIDPSALLSVFQKMQNQQNESRINPNNISHPLTAERIKNLKLQISESSKSRATSNNHALKMVQAKLIGYLGNTDHLKKDKSDPSFYARAIANMRLGDLEAAKTGTLTLIYRDKNNPYFYELLGDIEFQYGHYDDSVIAYEQALKLKNSSQIALALALVLSERDKPGDTERAIQLCKKAILKEPMPLAYWTLAKADAQKSDYYLAEYYYLVNNLPRAKTYAERATKKLLPKTSEYLKAKDILEMKE